MSSSDPSISSPQSQQHKMSKDQYTAILKDTFQKIQKTVPSRKNKELIDVCKQALGKLILVIIGRSNR